jgi:hypothetical protein
VFASLVCGVEVIAGCRCLWLGADVDGYADVDGEGGAHAEQVEGEP